MAYRTLLESLNNGKDTPFFVPRMFKNQEL
nr:MAG TPA: hypothetical protein [Caudoviricetes sp.]